MKIAKELIDFPNYSISDDGKVFHKRKELHQLHPFLDKDGYFIVKLPIIQGKYKACKIHHLILKTFIGPCPEGMEACHNDGNKGNNNLSNLRWDTPKNNSDDKKKHGTSLLCIRRGESNGRARLTKKQVLKIRTNYNDVTLKEIAVEFNVGTSTIHRIKKRKGWIHI